MLYTKNMSSRKFTYQGNSSLFSKSVVLTLLLSISVIFNIFFFLRDTDRDEGVPVIGVIDGDTIILEGKSKVRLRHIDAPDEPFCGSEDARKALIKLAMGKKVRVEELIPDQYGRGMALVYDGNTLINEKMIENGWVRYHHDISSEEEVLKQANEKAKEEKLGIYSLCQSTENTKNPKCVIKGNIDKSTDTHIYYLPNCAQYAYTVVEEDMGEEWFCTEKEAIKAGFTKAQTCK